MLAYNFGVKVAESAHSGEDTFEALIRKDFEDSKKFIADYAKAMRMSPEETEKRLQKARGQMEKALETHRSALKSFEKPVTLPDLMVNNQRIKNLSEGIRSPKL